MAVMKKHDALQGREIYLEFKPVGAIVKVIAIDAATGVEISISGPKSTAEYILKANAAKRLEYVLRKQGYIE